MSKLRGTIWEDIKPEYYAAGVEIERAVVENDPMQTINNIVIALRVALLKIRTSTAFTRIQAAITAAISAGNTTAYTGSSIPKTLMAGYIALIERNKNKGYAVSNKTPVVLTGYESHRAIVEPAFALTTNANTNVPNGTITIQYPITRAYTFDLAAALGSSGSKVALVLPMQRNRVANFRAQRIETDVEISNDSQSTYARESFQFTYDSDQFQICTIE